MQLEHIAFSKLKISKTNMRYRDPPPDVSDILPSIMTKGVRVPLIVRAEDNKFGIVAGRRRWFALKAKKDKLGEVDDPPCVIMEGGDDADAIEDSLLENVARRDPSPVREWENFVRLITEGRTVDGIAATFGLTKTQVNQRLALGNLLPKIRDLYRTEEIDDETVRHLTLASPSQQRNWLRLFNDPHQYAPRGYQLKQWLLGGQQIATGHALFKLSDYTGQIIEDLFGEDSYFADADLFWALQSRAIASKRDALLKSGWSEVVILEVGGRFQQYEHVRASKKNGGKVFIATAHDGHVEIFDGWLSQKEAKKLAKQSEREAGKVGKKLTTASGPVMTKALENYIDLHRHAVVRLGLIANPQVAWRLAVAHMAAYSGNWRVSSDPQTTRNAAIRASVENCAAEAAFADEERAVYALLGWQTGDAEDDEETFVRRETCDVFARLLDLSDADVMRIAACFMARSLACGSDVVEDVGARLNVDARLHWQPDDTFFNIIRDRVTVNALVAEVAGEAIAKANIAEKAKTQKQIVRDCLAGENGRVKVEGWLPGWMAFPAHGIGHAAQAVADAPMPMAAE
ncbi:MAG: chromosome partitioning protein ParB [Rhodospirillales bacterium 69-11]|jgi:ParB family chromosome partitioning protein|nr:MAG: chromosome partitioning protein ParB [Rhodospirillales bacterium 69-11]